MMKKVLILTVFFATLSLVFTNCSGGGRDDVATSDFYIKFKANGVQKEYKITRTDYKFKKSANHHFSIITSGRLVQSVDSESFSLNLYVPDNSTFDLKAGQYTPSYNTSLYYLDIVYFDGSLNYFDNPDNFVLNVTQIDKNTARGTFSGELETGITITEGEFYTKVYYSEVD